MKKPPFVPALIQRLAPEFGITVILEQRWLRLGEMILPNHKRRFFLGTDLGVNNSASAAIAQDKAYTHELLKRCDICVPESQAFSSERLNANLSEDNGIEKAIAWARKIGFPVYAKPNDLEHGELVTRVTSENELRVLAMRIFDRTDTMLLEREFCGRDFRVIVYDRQTLAAYERVPFGIEGDGHSTIDTLLRNKLEMAQNLKHVRKDFAPEDLSIDKTLRAQKVSRETVPLQGVRIRLLDNASLSTGGDAIDFSEAIHPEFSAVAAKAATAIGLSYGGVDILAADLTKSPFEQKYCVLEINSRPALGIFSRLGEKQKTQVDNIYRQMLRDIVRTTG